MANPVRRSRGQYAAECCAARGCSRLPAPAFESEYRAPCEHDRGLHFFVCSCGWPPYECTASRDICVDCCVSLVCDSSYSTANFETSNIDTLRFSWSSLATFVRRKCQGMQEVMPRFLGNAFNLFTQFCGSEKNL